MAAHLRVPRKPVIAPPLPTVETEQYVQERDHWRINLMEALGQDPLTIEEFTNLAWLVDMKLYPWDKAQSLILNMNLARWLSSKPIHTLITENFLVAKPEKHLTLLTDPTDNQMRRLTLLSSFIIKGCISVEGALTNYLDENCYTLLDNAQFVEREQKGQLNESDLILLDMMGVSSKAQTEVIRSNSPHF